MKNVKFQDSTINLITCVDSNYKYTAKKLIKVANKKNIFDSTKIYYKKDLDSKFVNEFKNILNLKKGSGYYIWKPFVINQELQKIREGDFLLYLDAGCTFNNSGLERFYEYLEIIKDSEAGIISFVLKEPECFWTSRAAFEYFGKMPESDKSGQIHASVLFMQKTKVLLEQVNLWLKTLYENPLLFTDDFLGDEIKGFCAHKYDQSIFSLIRKQFNPCLIEDETYFEEFNNNISLKYPFWATRHADNRLSFLKYYLNLK